MQMAKKNRGENSEEDSPNIRILSTARSLFYKNGVPTTGINQIIYESGTSKKSFYKYYPSKHELGAAFIGAEKNDFLFFFRKLSARYAQYGSFVKAWCHILRKEISCGRYHGCPFGNAAAQTGIEFRQELVEVIGDWIGVLKARLKNDFPRRTSRERDQIANRILMLYEGAIMLWKITGDDVYVNRLEKELLAIDAD